MARINRSEAVANQLMAATPRTPARPYRQPPRQLRVLRWMAGAVVVAAAIHYVL